MADLALVACTKTKSSRPGPAATLYVSALFRKSLLAALDRAKSVRILSAKHGLVELGAQIEPYEMTLKSMPAAERKSWCQSVGTAIKAVVKPRDRVLFFSGADYVEPLRDQLRDAGCVVELPLGSRSLGARLSYLRELNDEEALEAALPRFEALIRRLTRAQGGGRLVATCSGRQPWPQRGLYFITEPVGREGAALITRIGTHAVSLGSRTTLWDRVSTHRGAGHGGGSHRSSIFRSHVGRALIKRGEEMFAAPSTWGVGQSAPADVRASETELERRVSETIGAMRLLWLDVSDPAGPRSDRAYLERNIIGLLSRTNLLGIRTSPDETWLGAASVDWRIAASGLWNLDHLFYRPHRDFLDVLEAYVDAMVNGASRTDGPLAPSGWDQPAMNNDEQLSLFITEASKHDA